MLVRDREHVFRTLMGSWELLLPVWRWRYPVCPLRKQVSLDKMARQDNWYKIHMSRSLVVPSPSFLPHHGKFFTSCQDRILHAKPDSSHSEPKGVYISSKILWFHLPMNVLLYRVYTFFGGGRFVKKRWGDFLNSRLILLLEPVARTICTGLLLLWSVQRQTQCNIRPKSSSQLKGVQTIDVYDVYIV